MKSTDQKLFPCEQFSAERASAQLRHEQDYAHKARLARKTIDECKQEKKDKEADDAAFWKAVYVLTHIVGLLAVLTMIYEFWG